MIQYVRGLGRLPAGGGALPGRAGAGAEQRHRHRAREHDVVVVHLLPRPVALAGGAVEGSDRDRAGNQEESELLLRVRRGTFRGALETLECVPAGVHTRGC